MGWKRGLRDALIVVVALLGSFILFLNEWFFEHFNFARASDKTFYFYLGFSLLIVSLFISLSKLLRD